MASYRGHLAFSCALGAAYGGLASWRWGIDWGPAVLGAGVTALSGLLPDLDSDSSVPVRELFGLASAAVPFLLLPRMQSLGFTHEQAFVMLGGIYLLIRYGLRVLFGMLTVHRGMFHSLPAMFIAGLIVFLLYHSPNGWIRFYLGCGAMLGFLSHLVLDQLCSTDLMGGQVRHAKYAGSPLKLMSPSWGATLLTYAILGGLGYVTHLDLAAHKEGRSFFQSSFWSLPTAKQ